MKTAIDRPFEHLSDEELVTYVLSTDKNAFGELILRYNDRLTRYILSFTHDNDRASDIVEDALVNAYMHLGGFKQGARFSSWMYRIAHNVAMNYFQREKRHFHAILEYDCPLALDPHNPEDEAMDHEFANSMHQLVGALPVKYIAPLSLYYFDGYSYAEISVILQLSVNTVGTRIKRGKKLLKEAYEHDKSLSTTDHHNRKVLLAHA